VASAHNPRLVFPPFCLDLTAGRLLQAGREVPLRPKTWSVLRHLASKPGVLVSKEELLAEVWPGVAVTDDTLIKSIGEVRQALGDDPKAPRFLETVPRRGFRFVALPVSAGDVDEADDAVFVGREPERDALARHAATAQRGRRQIVFVAGEPGIGKTALVEKAIAAWRHGAGESGGLIGIGYSVEQRGPREAYLPLLTAVESLLRDDTGGALRALLRRVAPNWEAEIPWLAEPDAADLSPRVAAVRPERMQREFCAFVEEASRFAPLCLVLEDLHWSDPPTSELLFMLAQRRDPARLLVLGTLRPFEMTAHPLVQVRQTLARRGQCAELPLRGLTPANVRDYFEHRFPGFDCDDDLERTLHRQTGGNPLFLVAIADDLLGRGWLVNTEPGWALTVAPSRLEHAVPEDLRQMIQAQFDELADEDRALLEAASVVGVTFCAPTVSAGSGIPSEEVENALERLTRTHRFVKADRSHPGARPGHAFLHALHRRTVYESIGDARRRALHQRIGEALEAAAGERPSESAAELAVHFEASGDATRAMRYLTLAAQRVQAFAARESIAYAERALAILATLPRGRERGVAELALRRVLCLGEILHFGQASEVAVQACERVHELSEEFGSAEEVCAALFALWFTRSSRGDPESIVIGDRLCEAAAATGDPDLAAGAQLARGRTMLFCGRYEAALAVFEALCEHWGDRAGLTDDAIGALEPPGITSWLYAGIARAYLGYAREAHAHLAQAIRLTTTSGRPYVLAGAALHAAFLHHVLGEADEAAVQAGACIELSEKHGYPFWRGIAGALLGWAYGERGEHASAIAALDEGVALYRAVGASVAVPGLQAALAENLLRCGRWDEAAAALDRARTDAAGTLDRMGDAEILRIEAELVLATGDAAADPVVAAAAEALLRQALDLALERKTPLHARRVAARLAALLHDSGRRDDAHSVLAGVERPAPGRD
jgi:DNA-binding winged helix-turn-helix (wHTH) protein/tetratricopeptide (TPR) repeat protein